MISTNMAQASAVELIPRDASDKEKQSVRKRTTTQLLQQTPGLLLPMVR